MHIVKAWQCCRQKARQTATGLAACALPHSLCRPDIYFLSLFTSFSVLLSMLSGQNSTALLTLAGCSLFTCLVWGTGAVVPRRELSLCSTVVGAKGRCWEAAQLHMPLPSLYGNPSELQYHRKFYYNPRQFLLGKTHWSD